MLERIFHLKEFKTDVRTEIIAGITTFMTMSYIIFVQPAVLSACGMDFGAVMVATCLASAIATFLMALLANYPIALAPAMGHNFYFVYSVVLSLGVSWQVALGANFISGSLLIILLFFGLREKLIDCVPHSLKNAIAVGIGLLIALIGFEWSGIVVANPGTLIGLGNLNHPAVGLSIFGLGLTAMLISLRVKGAILWGMLISTLAGIFLGLVKFQGLVSLPPSIKPTFFKLDILGALNFNMLTVIFILFFLDIFDSVGTIIGISEQAGFIKEGKLPRAKGALLSDAIGTVEGTLLGTSTITSFIESATGVAVGGRTGLANIVTGILFLVALIFYPLVKMIGGGYRLAEGIILYPIIAPALIIVGSIMLANVRKIVWDDPTEAIPAFLTLVAMPFTFSITEGIAFGFISYALLKLITGRAKDVHWLIYTFAILFILRYIFLK
jgi:AGZA family xanthine/uracil permease-like MFS transporter